MKTSRTKKTQTGVIQEKQRKAAEKIEKSEQERGSSTLVKNWLSDSLTSEGTQMEWINKTLLINETGEQEKKVFWKDKERKSTSEQDIWG